MSRSTPRKKSSASSFPRPEHVLTALLLLSAAPVAAAEGNPYSALIYDFEVAGFCGLVDREVHDAFWVKRRALEAQMPQSTEEVTKIRVRAMADAERAYIDRGLGGHKPWCRSDGVAGVKRILGK